jgi:hypothetical protein
MVAGCRSRYFYTRSSAFVCGQFTIRLARRAKRTQFTLNHNRFFYLTCGYSSLSRVRAPQRLPLMSTQAHRPASHNENCTRT